MLHPGAEPVSGFHLQSLLGAGAFGEVWAATAPDGSAVALKFIDSRKRDPIGLRSEIRILRALSDVGHPNLVRLFGVYASSHYLVLSMERADGNLDELRRTYREVAGRNVPPDHLMDLLAQTARGLDFIAGIKLPGFNLSSSGMQHCDVKPTNLLLLGDEVKIADFGLCAALGQQTHRQGWRGTLPYAAPELYHGRASPATDQFSLAVTYCELVAGDRILRRGIDGRWLPGMPIDLDAARSRERPVLARALAPDPLDRWPSCEAFVSALKQVALAPSGPVRRLVRSGATRRPFRA